MNKKQKKMLIRILTAAVCMVVFSMLSVSGYLRFALFMVPYLIIGYDILKKAGKGILNRQVFDENFLMAVATVGARYVRGDFVRGIYRGRCGYAVLPDWRTVSELCCGQEPQEYQ